MCGEFQKDNIVCGFLVLLCACGSLIASGNNQLCWIGYGWGIDLWFLIMRDCPGKHSLLLSPLWTIVSVLCGSFNRFRQHQTVMDVDGGWICGFYYARLHGQAVSLSFPPLHFSLGQWVLVFGLRVCFSPHLAGDSASSNEHGDEDEGFYSQQARIAMAFCFGMVLCFLGSVECVFSSFSQVLQHSKRVSERVFLGKLASPPTVQVSEFPTVSNLMNSSQQ